MDPGQISLAGYSTRLPVGSYERMEFSSKLKRLMGIHRYSQGLLAQKLDVSQNKVSTWTRGLVLPDLREAVVLSRLFGVDVNYLANDALDDPPESPEDDERAILDLVHALELDKREALRRLATAPRESQAVTVPQREGEPEPRRPRYGKVIADQDATEAHLRREQEARDRQIEASRAKAREKRAEKEPKGKS